MPSYSIIEDNTFSMKKTIHLIEIDVIIFLLKKSGFCILNPR
jgi:hypothetical protein